MKEIQVLNNKFEAASKLEVGIDLSPEAVSMSAVHQVVKATLAGRRQGNASTKNRSMVSGGGAKPFKQKGTGRARQGSSRSPLMPGGGVAFGPSPRSYEQKVNKKMMLLAIRSVLVDKFNAGKLVVLDSIESDGKTKNMFETLSTRNLLPGLVVTSSDDSQALRATKNIKNAKALPVNGFSVYEAVKYENLIIEKEALQTLLGKLS